MCVQTEKNKANIPIIYLILKMGNSQKASEGDDGEFITTSMTSAVCLAVEKGHGVVCTACVNNIGPANEKDSWPINHSAIYWASPKRKMAFSFWLLFRRLFHSPTPLPATTS